jgi:hypothetical protein
MPFTVCTRKHRERFRHSGLLLCQSLYTPLSCSELFASKLTLTCCEDHRFQSPSVNWQHGEAFSSARQGRTPTGPFESCACHRTFKTFRTCQTQTYLIFKLVCSIRLLGTWNTCMQGNEGFKQICSKQTKYPGSTYFLFHRLFLCWDARWFMLLFFMALHLNGKTSDMHDLKPALRCSYETSASNDLHCVIL